MRGYPSIHFQNARCCNPLSTHVLPCSKSRAEVESAESEFRPCKTRCLLRDKVSSIHHHKQSHVMRVGDMEFTSLHNQPDSVERAGLVSDEEQELERVAMV